MPLLRSARTVCLILLTSHVALAAGIWNEIGDAGRLPDNAQVTIGVGALDDIFGRLADGVIGGDMYLIRITNFNAFSATSAGVGKNGVVDPALYLFNFTGHGIYASDNISAMNTQAMLPAGDPNGPDHNGLFFILIAPSGNDPLNKFGNSIFPCGCTAGVLAPQTKNTVIDSYSNTGVGPNGSGRYDIQLTGAAFANIPEPGTFGFIGVGAVVGGILARRRKLASARTPISPA